MKILVAGAGIRGKRIVDLLQVYHLSVCAFIDNDPEKWNCEIIKGIVCYPVDYFTKNEAEYIVIVSPENPKELFCFLQKIYSNVLDPKIAEIIVQAAYNVGYDKFFPIGHFYSLYPDIRDVLKGPDYAEIDGTYEIPGVNLYESIQKTYLEKMITLYQTIPMWKKVGESDSQKRYRVGNPSLSYGDAVGLFCILNIIKPKRLIEVGFGY